MGSDSNCRLRLLCSAAVADASPDACSSDFFVAVTRPIRGRSNDTPRAPRARQSAARVSSATVKSMGDNFTRRESLPDRFRPSAMRLSVKGDDELAGRRPRTWYMVASAPEP